MLRKTFAVSLCFMTAALGFGCASSETTENNANQPVNIIIDQKNLPPEFSTAPMNTGGNAPGIDPSNANLVAKPGGTPTPGIPDPSTIGKTPMPKGTPPIPGIPDEETLKKQMSQPRNADDVNKIPSAGTVGNSAKRPIDRSRSLSNQQ